jgi:hypothetical protein
MSEEPKTQKRQPADPYLDETSTESLQSDEAYREARAAIWEAALAETSQQRSNQPSSTPEEEIPRTPEQQEFWVWIGKFLEIPSSSVVGKVFGVGCDMFFLMEFTYQYCSPEPDPLDQWAAHARSLRAVIPDYVKKVRKLSKELKRLEAPKHLEIFGKEFKPEAKYLERYADQLDAFSEELKCAGTRGSLRPFYLLCMSYHIRTVFPERWRGSWMKKSVHADIRDFVNAGFMTFGIDKDLSEDQIRHLCARFETRFPQLAKYANELSKERPMAGKNVYEWLFQRAMRRDPDSSAE